MIDVHLHKIGPSHNCLLIWNRTSGETTILEGENFLNNVSMADCNCNIKKHDLTQLTRLQSYKKIISVLDIFDISGQFAEEEH